MRKKVDEPPARLSSARILSKLQKGSVRRSLWIGARASPRASRDALTTRPPSRSAFTRAAAPSSPLRVHFQGVSTSASSPHAGAAQLLERWVEWVERGAGRAKPAVLVARRVPLLDA